MSGRLVILSARLVIVSGRLVILSARLDILGGKVSNGGKLGVDRKMLNLPDRQCRRREEPQARRREEPQARRRARRPWLISKKALAKKSVMIGNLPRSDKVVENVEDTYLFRVRRVRE